MRTGYIHNRHVYLTSSEWRRAVWMWETGRDTETIAKEFGCHQAAIHNRLPHYREVFKGVSEVERVA